LGNDSFLIFMVRVNRFIKIMIFSDFVMWSAFGLVGPIFAVYITQQIPGGSLAVVGFASGLQLILKSILQIPISRWIDKNRGEWDDFYTAIAGSFLLSLVPFFYIFMRTPADLYFVQIIYALGAAMNFPGWVAIFTRHVDKGREGFEWSVYNTSVSIGAGITGAIGGFLAEKTGFLILFIIMGILNIMGTAFLLLIRGGIITAHGIPRVARLGARSAGSEHKST
jgi:hypothetical protein